MTYVSKLTEICDKLTDVNNRIDLLAQLLTSAGNDAVSSGDAVRPLDANGIMTLAEVLRELDDRLADAQSELSDVRYDMERAEAADAA